MELTPGFCTPWLCTVVCRPGIYDGLSGAPKDSLSRVVEPHAISCCCGKAEYIGKQMTEEIMGRPNIPPDMMIQFE